MTWNLTCSVPMLPSISMLPSILEQMIKVRTQLSKKITLLMLENFVSSLVDLQGYGNYSRWLRYIILQGVNIYHFLVYFS